jgi:hypothetical protein
MHRRRSETARCVWRAEKNNVSALIVAFENMARWPAGLGVGLGVGDSGSRSSLLWLAAEEGRADLVRALLLDERADAAWCDSKALQSAAWRGHADVVRLLLADGRADPTAAANYIALFMDSRVDTEPVGSAALQYAAYKGNADIVRALLSDGRADPATLNYEALRCAASRSHAAVVQLLLADGRSDPTVVPAAHCGPRVWPVVQAARRWRGRRAWLRMGAFVAVPES